MKKFPSDIAAEIKSLITMEDVACRYGFEVKHGFISCPFHPNDDTPSLKLYPEDRGFHCFGCNEHGSVIDFTMKLFSISFGQALIRLSSDFCLGLPTDRPNKIEAKNYFQLKKEKELFKRKRNEEFSALVKERRALWEIIVTNSPKNTGDEISTQYASAAKRISYIDYLLDNLYSGGDSNKSDRNRAG